jgi:probable metal-binding protein
MQTLIHAHKVLEIIGKHAQPVPDAELRNQVAGAFGADAIFVNCQDRQFSLDQLIEFLASKDKIGVTDGHISLNVDNLCEE